MSSDEIHCENTIEHLILMFATGRASLGEMSELNPTLAKNITKQIIEYIILILDRNLKNYS